MTYTFKLSRRLARLRGPLIASPSSPSSDAVSSDAFDPGHDGPGTPLPPTPALATSFAGGIPCGIFAQPTERIRQPGTTAPMRTISPTSFWKSSPRSRAVAARSCSCSRARSNYLQEFRRDLQLHRVEGTDRQVPLGQFLLLRQRRDRHRALPDRRAIRSGELSGVSRSRGPRSTRWPSTASRSGPAWRPSSGRSRPHQVERDLPVPRRRLGPVRSPRPQGHQRLPPRERHGRPADGSGPGRRAQLSKGAPRHRTRTGGSPMTPSEVKEWGGALLSSTYPCAFISWQYEDRLLSSSGMGAAMDTCARRPRTGPPRAASSAPAPSRRRPRPDTTRRRPAAPAVGAAAAAEHGRRRPCPSGWSSRRPPSTHGPGRCSRRRRRAGWPPDRRPPASKMKLIVMLAVTSQVKNADGTFSLTKWKAEVDQYRSLSLGSRITTRPSTSTTWWISRSAPPAGAARRSRGPRSRTWRSTASRSGQASRPPRGSRRPSSPRPPSGGPTSTPAGRSTTPRRATSGSTWPARSRGQGRGSRPGGGTQREDADGRQHRADDREPDQGVRHRYRVGSDVCAMTGWKYDATYLAQTGIRAAFDSVASVAKTRTAGSCARS